MAGNAVTDLIRRDALNAGIDPRWALATAQTESSLNPQAVSPAGARGVMQLMPATAQGLGVDPNNVAQNIQGGVDLLAQNLKRYGNPRAASAAYFGGTDPKNWGPKTRAYVEKVAGNYAKDARPMTSPQTASSQPDAAATINGYFQRLSGPSGAVTAPPGASLPSTSTAAASAASQAAPAGDADTIKSFFARTQQAQTTQQKKGLTANFKAGAEDVLRVPGEWVDRQLHGTIVGNALGVPSAAQDQATFERDHQDLGNSIGDQIARFGGQALMAAPVLATGEGALGAATDIAGGALDAAGADGLGTAARAAGNFVRGAGGKGMGGITGLGVRGASLAAQGAAQGAGFNALTGASPAQGAKIGAVAAPLLGGAGAVVGGVASHTFDALRPNATKAASVVRNALMADGIDPDAAAATVGPHGNRLVNTPSANVSALAQSIANKPGPGAQVIRKTLDDQAASAPSDLGHAVLLATGSKGDVHDLDEAVATAQKQAAAPLYDDAYSVGPVWNDKLAALLKRPAVARAWNRARDIAANEGIDLPKVFKTDPQGNIVGVEETPDMQTWDFIKRGLDDEVRAHAEPITGKIKTDAARGVNAVRKELVNALDQANPAYAKARAAYAGPARVREAIQMGRDALKSDAEITAKQIQGMSGGQRQAFQAGVARALLDKIEGSPDGTNVARKIFGNQTIRNRIEAAFDDPTRFKQFQALAEAKAAQVAARNEIIGNSKTALREAAQGHNWGTTLGHALYETAVGSPQRGALMIARQAAGAARRPENPALETAIANLLTNPNGDEVRGALAAGAPGNARSLLMGGAGAAGRAARLYGPVSVLAPPQRAGQ